MLSRTYKRPYICPVHDIKVMDNSRKSFVLFMQVAFAFGISFGLKANNFDKQLWLVGIARYLLYFLVIRATNEGSALLYKILNKKASLDPPKIIQDVKEYALVAAASVGVLLYTEQKLITEDFLLIFAANLLLTYNDMEQKPTTITYGVGMACSFFEGYLKQVIPSDGHKFVGFQENIERYENAQGVVFPVRRLFIIMTRSLYSPPDLKQFNKENRDDLSQLEACQVSPESLKEIEKDVAGVKNRIYKNSAYMIRRAGAAPVFVAAECATPLHTLHEVLHNTTLYQELSNMNTEEVVADFSKMLTSIISKSPQCRDKCELVYFDDTDPNQNLADVLLDKIREIEPNFEKVTRK
ncbi:stimulator of interferon genes protein isoform X2 [Manduca sexta]|uniref:stimulator of interferon genes protein isoform X2 n=1 Tax=Manduca sexta TaxID=7130 RepID=UPI0018907CDC|nr:stimulator of interferon genes protein isoform X2 [Manduca sexta]